jgi:glycosyltransferase involved in cell wall biosynthesis
MATKKVLLVSNRVLHYRVSVYNYFSDNFHKHGWKFLIRSDSIQLGGSVEPAFDFKVIPFDFWRYRDEIETIKPDVVILFLHLKNFIFWPLVHWLRYKKIPVIFWTKGLNLEQPNRILSRLLYHYTHGICDGILLYTDRMIKYVWERHRYKVLPANNTVNYHGYPDIKESVADIKMEFNIPFKKVVLFAGNMGLRGERKKVEHLVRIFREIDNSEYGLIIVGSGMPDEVRAMVNEKNTIIFGEVQDPQNIKISKLFRCADIFCIPGHLGLGVNQAFYWRLPVVTEKGNHPPEFQYLKDGRNGFVVEENDLRGLRDKLEFLFENDAVRMEMGDNAREDLLREANIDTMFSQFLKMTEYVFLLKKT